MSYKHLLACGAIAMALVSCNKELDNPQTPAGPVEGDSYVALNINLPTTTGTRAAGNINDFNDGDAKEFEVNKIAIVFYTLNNGSYSYIEHTTVVPTPWMNENDASKEITSKVKATYKLDKVNAGTDLFTLVLINPDQNGITDFTVSYENMIAKTTGFDKTISDNGKGQFFMVNAPVISNGTYEILVPVTAQATENDAKNNPCTIYVERALAKVELSLGDAFKTAKAYTLTDNAHKDDVVTMTGWNIDITNKTSNLVRNIDATWTAPWITSARPYYSIDANFDSSTGINDFQRCADPGVDDFDGEYRYCYENTMVAAQQMLDRTTSVLIKATYVPAAENITKGANETYDGKDWYMVGTAKTPHTLKGLQETIANTLVNAGCSAEAAKTESEKITVPTTAGKMTLNSVTVGEGNDAITYNLATLVGDVYFYNDAICYYLVPIRHFLAEENGYVDDDDFWVNYRARNGQYVTTDMGRYGVVRNNWYKLTINSVSQPGEPVIPTPDSTNPGNDDQIESYVSCDIQIIAWSVRNHGIDL